MPAPSTDRIHMRIASLTALALTALALLGVLAAPGTASADSYFSIRGASAPGPLRYDRVFVDRIGSIRARRVLVLIPGSQGGAGSLVPVARDIVARVRGTQAWIVDRREQAFEDTRGFRGRDPHRALDFYLGFKYHQYTSKNAAFARRWGLAVSLNDIRRVVLRARAGGRRHVILGGHSLGASTAAAYAAWDFHGRAGYRDIDGLVLIDGGLLGSFSRGSGDLSLAAARRGLREIATSEPFDSLLPGVPPSAPPIFSELLALFAAKAPQSPSALQSQPIVPASLKPPFAVTNQAFLGYIFDKTTSPKGFESLRTRSGRLARSGSPRRWVDGERTPIERLAAAFSAERPNATEWYFPKRLSLDIDGANPMRSTPTTRLLGLRLFHTRQIDVPLYAFETDLTHGGVIRAARRLVARSRIRHYKVAFNTGMSHLDAVLASPAQNTFLHTVVPFLRRLR